MLIKCLECDGQISSLATTCPHCGCPTNIKASDAKAKKKPKRQKLPNGFGRITEIKNKNLRCRYRVMVTSGKDKNGKPIGRLLKPQSYFKTYNEAYQALVEYNKNPYDLDNCITVNKLYEKWYEEYSKFVNSESSLRTISSAWNYCHELYDINVRDIRARHIKGVIENGYIIEKKTNVKRYASAHTKCRIKSVWNLLMDYALEYELTDRNYARTFEISKDVIKEKEDATIPHITFTDEELTTLWKNINYPYVNVVLLQCYSGWRPQELGLLRLDQVNLTNWVFTGGMKTEAGTNRTVPIHTAIRPIVKKLYEQALSLESEYLINCTDTHTHRSSYKFTYDKYNKRFHKIITDLKLNPDHRPHDGRKQFVTMAKKYKVDEYAIKRMIGHAINDITEKVYTERNIGWLRSEIEKIKGPNISA